MILKDRHIAIAGLLISVVSLILFIYYQEKK